MSPTSYRTAPPRDEDCILRHEMFNVKQNYLLFVAAVNLLCELVDGTFSLNFTDRYVIGTGMIQLRLALGIIILLVLCALSFIRSAIYEDEVSLYTDIVSKPPGKARPHNNLGDALKKANRVSEAEPCFRRALELQPAYPDALNNLATIYNSTGRGKEGLELLSQALALDPGHLQARFNLAFVLYEKGMLADAELHFAILIQTAPLSKEGVFSQKMLGLIKRQKTSS